MCILITMTHIYCIDRTTNVMFPGSYYAPKINYITVVANSIDGKQLVIQHPMDYIRMLFQQTTSTDMMEAFAYESYLTVCGNGNEKGDGIIPCVAGHLDGATQITLLGVQHSFLHFPGNFNWYGSPNVIRLWHDVMLAELFAKEYEEKERLMTKM